MYAIITTTTTMPTTNTTKQHLHFNSRKWNDAREQKDRVSVKDAKVEEEC